MGLHEDAEASDAPLLHFAAKRLEDERLIVVSNIPGRGALAAYRKRQAIECMFGDAKTRGLDIEDARITDPGKLALLMALVAWAGRAAADLLGIGAPKRKAPGEIALMPRRVEVLQGRGRSVADAVRRVGVTRNTCHRWREEHGGMDRDRSKRLKALEAGDWRLRWAVSDLTPDGMILAEAARGTPSTGRLREATPRGFPALRAAGDASTMRGGDRGHHRAGGRFKGATAIGW